MQKEKIESGMDGQGFEPKSTQNQREGALGKEGEEAAEGEKGVEWGVEWPVHGPEALADKPVGFDLDDLDSLIETALKTAETEAEAGEKQARLQQAVQEYRDVGKQLETARDLQGRRSQRIKAIPHPRVQEEGMTQLYNSLSSGDYLPLERQRIITKGDREAIEKLAAAIERLNIVPNPSEVLKEQIAVLTQRRSQIHDGLKHAIGTKVEQEHAEFDQRRQRIYERAVVHYGARVARLKNILAQLEYEHPDIATRVKALEEEEERRAQQEQMAISQELRRQVEQALQIAGDRHTNALIRIHQITGSDFGNSQTRKEWLKLLIDTRRMDPSQRRRLDAVRKALHDAVLTGTGERQIKDPKEVAPWAAEYDQGGRRYRDAVDLLREQMEALPQPARQKSKERADDADETWRAALRTLRTELPQNQKGERREPLNRLSVGVGLTPEQSAALRKKIEDCLDDNLIIGRVVGARLLLVPGGKKVLSPFYSAFGERRALEESGRSQRNIVAAGARAVKEHPRGGIQRKESGVSFAASPTRPARQTPLATPTPSAAQVGRQGGTAPRALEEAERKREYLRQHKGAIDALLKRGGIPVNIGELPGAVLLEVVRGKRGKKRIRVAELAGAAKDAGGIRVGMDTPDANGLSGFPEFMRTDEALQAVRRLMQKDKGTADQEQTPQPQD